MLGTENQGRNVLRAESIEKYRRLLTARRQEIGQLEPTNDEDRATVELDQQSVGRLSRMDAIQRQAMAQETRRRRNLEVQRIANALRRIDEDEYGYCAECGEEIGEKRLQVDPTATLCIGCAR